MDGKVSAQRAAKNQSLYRSVNEEISQLNVALSEAAPDTEPIGEWICECADPACTERIEATRGEYETVRASGRTFIVRPGHIYPEIERVTAENERFMVVEKFDKSGRIAEALDPRSGAEAPEPA